MLESVKGPPKIARYSFIGFEPYSTLRVKNGRHASGEVLSKNPLSILQGELNRYVQRPDPSLPPFQGGAVGLLSYDFVRYLEHLPSIARDDLEIPDADFMLVDRLMAFDHVEKKAWIVVCPGARHGGDDWSEAFDEAEAAIAEIARAASLGSAAGAPLLSGSKRIEIVYELAMEGYTDMVRRAKEYIAAGDIFQANLSLRVSAFIGSLRPWNLYAALRGINPAPFAAYMDMGDYVIASSSPERLLRVSDGVVETRPIAGTRPRGKDSEEDTLMRAELLLSEKERAEHIMLIDLERNDIGRVCDYGSVEVDELMITEDCSHVMHIVSNVRGRLNGGRSAVDAVRAVFPGGTITGVPKVRCMEIIEELEPLRRGPYTGSIGYIGFSGGVDFNIVIRSFAIKNETAYVQAGAGIVADSEPEREYREALKKAEALIKTLEGGLRAP